MLAFFFCVFSTLFAQNDSVEISVQGHVWDKNSKKPIAKATAVLFELDEEGILTEICSQALDSTASYYFKIKINKDYKVVAGNGVYLANESKFSTKGLEYPKNEMVSFIFERNIGLVMGCNYYDPITFENIYFAPQSYFLGKESKYILDKVVHLLLRHPNVELEIEGHSDLAETEDSFSLADSRAKGAIKYLYDMGISPEKLNWTSNGNTKVNDKGENISHSATFRIVGIAGK